MNPKSNYEEMLKLQQNTQMLERYLQDTEMQSQELEMIYNALEDFEKEKKDKEILVPIVNGIFFKAKITDNSKFLINIGAEGILTEMGIDKSKDLILKQIHRTKENQILITNELNTLIEKLKETE